MEEISSILMEFAHRSPTEDDLTRLKYLAVENAAILFKSPKNFTALLMEAIVTKDVRVAKVFTDILPADKTGLLEKRYNFACTCLHAGALHGSIAIVDLLLSFGADINSTNASQSRTPLHFAAMSQNIGMMKFLIDRGADPKIENKKGLTAFDTARRELEADMAFHENSLWYFHFSNLYSKLEKIIEKSVTK